MPMPTIPGIPPETWEQLLQILAQLNTSVVELGEQGITTFEQLRQWLTLQGYELVEISEVVGYTIAKTEAVDPTTTNAEAAEAQAHSVRRNPLRRGLTGGRTSDRFMVTCKPWSFLFIETSLSDRDPLS